MIDPSDFSKPTKLSPPVGTDPSSLPSFAKLKNERIHQYRVLSGTALDPVTGLELDPSASPDWKSLVKLEKAILENESKSLEVAAWFVEDSIRLGSLQSLAGGLKLLHKLQSEYWDTLFPLADDGDHWVRAGILNGFASGVSSALRELPFSNHPFASLQIWEQLSDGRSVPSFTLSDIGTLLSGMSKSQRNSQIQQLEASQLALGELNSFIEDKYSNDDDISLFPLEQTLLKCKEMLLRYAAQPTATEEMPSVATPTEPQTGVGSEMRPPQSASVQVPTTLRDRIGTLSFQIPDVGPSSLAIQAKALPYKNGLKLFQQGYDHSKTGRQRFILRLELSEFCLEANLVELARPLLTELWGISEKKMLQDWEDPQLWARLVAAQHKVALSPPERPSNQAAQNLFDTLCKVDIERAYTLHLAKEK